MAEMQQEELARLFQANLNLSHIAQQQVASPQPKQGPGEQNVQQPEPEPQASETTQSAQPITYASTHYTHSYHVAPARHVPSAPVKTQICASELEAILLRNSVDPSLLFPSQIDLFQNADDDQRLRLLELWRISPPQGRQGYPVGVDYNTSRQLYDWPPTSLAQEEAMAKLRYEKMMEDNVQSEEIRSYQQELDQSMDGGSQSVVQDTRDGRTASPEAPSAEPYIVSGYDMLAKREYEESARTSGNLLRESNRYNQATDPVYNQSTGNGGGLWQKNVGSIFDMENNYGAFAYAREHDIRPIYADDEMVM